VPQGKPNPEADRLVSEFIAQHKQKYKSARAKMVTKAKEIIRKYEALRG